MLSYELLFVSPLTMDCYQMIRCCINIQGPPAGQSNSPCEMITQEDPTPQNITKEIV